MLTATKIRIGDIVEYKYYQKRKKGKPIQRSAKGVVYSVGRDYIRVQLKDGRILGVQRRDVQEVLLSGEEYLAELRACYGDSISLD